MKKILLSGVAVATMATMANASTASDIKALKAQMAAMAEKLESLETKKAEEIKAEKVAKVKKSKVPVLEFSGKHYLGFVSDDSENRFETRRNYFQVKAFFEDDPKSYMRVTLDTHQVDDGKDGDGVLIAGKDLDGTWNVRLKYAYLYLDSILPHTGVEIGQSHRPWIGSCK